MLLLRPLSDALADGDRIHATILSTHINHGGKTNGYTVPNPRAQAELIARNTRVDSESVLVGWVPLFHDMGLTGGILNAMYTGARTLRLADGPDEVHRILIAKNVLARFRGSDTGWDFGN